jgi:hypothetical protein
MPMRSITGLVAGEATLQRKPPHLRIGKHLGEVV